MTLEAIYYIGQTIAVVAVVASLVFVGLQIRHNERTQRLASIQSVLNGHRDRISAWIATDPSIADLFSRGLTDYGGLDANERRQFAHMLLDTFFQMQQIIELHSAGVLSHEDHDAWLAYTAALLRTSGGQGVWAEFRNLLTPKFVERMDRELAKEPEGPSLTDLAPLYLADSPVRRIRVADEGSGDAKAEATQRPKQEPRP